MLGALLIVFREVLEAGLIVGIVMAATRGVPGRGRWITIGIAGGVLGAGIVAMPSSSISAKVVHSSSARSASKRSRSSNVFA